MIPEVGVVDYGMGNIGSVMNMFVKIGVSAVRVSSPRELLAQNRVLLPGVGSYDRGVSALRERDLVSPLVGLASSGVPILGICLGMQLLVQGSEEGVEPGLGLIDGTCRRFRNEDTPQNRVPHMGWAEVHSTIATALMTDVGSPNRFYFVHSYHVDCDDPRDVLARSSYGQAFNSLIGRGNVMGAQFHPEKSHIFGMRLLENFSKI